MTNPIFTRPAGEPLTLDVVTAAVRTEIGELPATMVSSGTVTAYHDAMVGRSVLKLKCLVAEEKLPPQPYHTHVTDPRWATWWDHLKATYRQRWWARAFVRRWPPRTVDTTVYVAIDTALAWHYPDTPLYREGLGRPVLWTNTTTRHWRVDE